MAAALTYQIYGCRCLLEKWLAHYRTHLGITQQDILSFDESALTADDSVFGKAVGKSRIAPAIRGSALSRATRLAFTQSAPSGSFVGSIITTFFRI
jgi:hypothetical protein